MALLVPNAVLEYLSPICVLTVLTLPMEDLLAALNAFSLIILSSVPVAVGCTFWILSMAHAGSVPAISQVLPAAETKKHQPNALTTTTQSLLTDTT